MEPPPLCNQERGCLDPAPVIAVLGSEYRADPAFVSCSGDSESWTVDVFLLRNLALLSRAANEPVCSGSGVSVLSFLSVFFFDNSVSVQLSH